MKRSLRYQDLNRLHKTASLTPLRSLKRDFGQAIFGISAGPFKM
jgi:hypothetical protein